MTRGVAAWLHTATAAFIAVSAGYGIAAPPPGPETPRVFCDVEIIRKIRQGYLVTPTALIPFTAEVRHNNGLARAEYIVTVARLEAGGKVGREGKEQTVPIESFNRRSQRVVREFRIAADDAPSALDLSKLPHLFPEPGADQPSPRYRMRVWLEATDNDNKTGPHSGQSEPITFVVVPELDLLVEVAKDEELLQICFEDRVLDRLRRAQSKLRTLNERLAAVTPDQLPYLSARAQEVAEAVERATEYAQDVHADFRRIARELRTNRVRANMIDRVEKKICEPLDEVLRREFVPATALRDLSKRLESDDVGQMRKAGAAASKQIDELVGRVDKTVAAIRELDEINRHIRKLRDIEDLIFNRR
jgi:hypothetical protein